MPELTQTPIVTPSLELQNRVSNRQRLAKMKTEIEKQMEAENEEIKNLMLTEGFDETEIDNWNVTLSLRERSSLDKTELVNQGVSTEQIARATKVVSYVQLDVREKKKKEKE